MSENEIHQICENYGIKNYTINPDMSIDVDGNVSFYFMGLPTIPLIFNKVHGHFRCNDNFLTTLEGCPKYVSGDFHCSKNKLISFKGCPNYIGGWFFGDKLTTRNTIMNVYGHIISECFWKF